MPIVGAQKLEKKPQKRLIKPKRGNIIARIGIRVVLVVFIIALLLVGLEIWRLYTKIELGRNLIHGAVPYAVDDVESDERILIMGDSLAVGVGASEPKQSIAGLFHQDHPDAQIFNFSVSGFKLEQINSMMQGIDGQFDLIVVIGGANDILFFSKKDDSVAWLDQILQKARAHADTVVLVTSGNMGNIPMFAPPLTWYFDARSRAFLDAFRESAVRNGILYVDLFAEPEVDVFALEPDTYYTEDLLHLSDEGYKLWYERIRLTLEAGQAPILSEKKENSDYESEEEVFYDDYDEGEYEPNLSTDELDMLEESAAEE